MIFSSGFNLCRFLLFVYINLSWIQLSEREGWAPFNQFTPYFCVCPNITQCVVGFCVINCLKWEVIAHLVDIGTPSTATDFRFVFIILHITMLTSSWPPVVCRRVHVLFTLFVVSNTYCVVFLFCLSSCCVPCIAKFCGLFICDYWYYYMQLFWSVFNTATQLKNAVRRVWRYQRGNKNQSIEEQTTQWPTEKVQKDKQRSTRHTHKTKDRVIRAQLKTRGKLRCSGRVCSSSSTSKNYISHNDDKHVFVQDFGNRRSQLVKERRPNVDKQIGELVNER